jgi:hypothetical protein
MGKVMRVLGAAGLVVATMTTGPGPAHALVDPVITSLQPASGPPGGGGTVTIHGWGFQEDFTTVHWGELSIVPEVVTDTALELAVPPGQVGEVAVWVHVGEGATSAVPYTYVEDEPSPTSTAEPSAPALAPAEPGSQDPEGPRRRARSPREARVPDVVVRRTPPSVRLADTGPRTTAPLAAAGVALVLTGGALLAATRRGADRVGRARVGRARVGRARVGGAGVS